MPSFRTRAILAVCCIFLGGTVMAQPYPSHTVKIVVPFPPAAPTTSSPASWRRN
jgi:tripartite-type tricarboxylate transporter receptor subunit TctC